MSEKTKGVFWGFIVCAALVFVLGGFWFSFTNDKGVRDGVRQEVSLEGDRHSAPTSSDQNSVRSESDDPVSNADVLAAWERAINDTPPPAGADGWKRIKPRATGEKGCTPGETRVNPNTGRLQGCL